MNSAHDFDAHVSIHPRSLLHLTHTTGFAKGDSVTYVTSATSVTGLAYDSDASVSSVDSSTASDKPLVKPHQKLDKRRAASAERAPAGGSLKRAKALVYGDIV